jgi:hypothetical protein
LPGTPSISGPRSAASPCFTPGANNCTIIDIHNTWPCQPLDFT